MTIEALVGDVVALLDHLGIAEADLFGLGLGGLVACAVALGAPDRVGKLIVASADAHRPPGRQSMAAAGVAPHRRPQRHSERRECTRVQGEVRSRSAGLAGEAARPDARPTSMRGWPAGSCGRRVC
jgi:pimeloyl-ACP methyl ester carboxylesterase